MSSLWGGRGDVGLLTSLSFREIDSVLGIRMVDDLESPPPRLGKSTFSAFVGLLHDFLGIDQESFVSEVKPVSKRRSGSKSGTVVPHIIILSRTRFLHLLSSIDTTFCTASTTTPISR